MVKVASVQMVSGPSVEQNLNDAKSLLEQAARSGAQLAVLPEYFCLMGQHDSAKLEVAEDFGNGPIQFFLAEQAKRLGLYIVGGTLPLKTGAPDKVFNTSLVYDPQGQQIARYDKIHLFCFKTSSESYDEGKVLKAGDQPVSVQCGDLNVGLSTCYDLRFPELYRAIGVVDLIVVPSAFTYTTGHAHWELLLRARAVENQCFVLGSGQGGLHENGRRTWGHSMIVDPWGEVLVCNKQGPSVAIAELDTDKMEQIRSRLPALTHRVM